MYAKFINIAITAILMGLAPAACAETNADLQRLIGWFGGEWDNHEQVWQQRNEAEAKKIEKIDDPIPHTHHIFAPVKAPDRKSVV